MRALVAFILASLLSKNCILAEPHATILGCQVLNNCNGHGKCRHALGECVCDTGYGSPDEIESILGGFRPSADCSRRVCPLGKAWASVPESDNRAHDATAECSNAGRCDRETGRCSCFPGFRGAACEKRTCPGSDDGGRDCSGHGRCVSLRHMASAPDGLPLSSSDADYSGELGTTTWDQDRIFGCICDSSWSVGLGAGERQESEWFGADCSLKRCPSGDNPDTIADETDCTGVVAEGGRGTGDAGNVCHHDCSGKGQCDYNTGTCKCHEGHIGVACEERRVR